MLHIFFSLQTLINTVCQPLAVVHVEHHVHPVLSVDSPLTNDSHLHHLVVQRCTLAKSLLVDYLLILIKVCVWCKFLHVLSVWWCVLKFLGEKESLYAVSIIQMKSRNTLFDLDLWKLTGRTKLNQERTFHPKVQRLVLAACMLGRVLKCFNHSQLNEGSQRAIVLQLSHDWLCFYIKFYFACTCIRLHLLILYSFFFQVMHFCSFGMRSLCTGWSRAAWWKRTSTSYMCPVLLKQTKR